MSEKLSRSFILLFFLVFYQLDYRERVTGSISIPGFKEISVTKSFETRYRPIKKSNKEFSIHKNERREPPKDSTPYL
ncbi:MAG: hypothetical protein ACOVP4_11365 [Bacteriovoracaceae bacterium]|jgi:hypothetical protein